MSNKRMSVQEAADYLGVHHDTVYSMVRTKEIPHFKVRSRIFFREHTLDQWITAQEEKILKGVTA
ncbi:helix-turn-helix domain-containing protein [Bacillus safensis]|uniref:helix-turn-helix domain-containing protein n=1 Tax=Bacillus TaxID=1386 RepID=UPI0011A0A8EB|nr:MULTISPECIES: helix-turn-helix domain-containing protein [Bacillus]MCY7585478.1 helix-turn-helix domain-containing protein [Bacillus safensis]MCY7586913.1 helix-turn-helix domain-containing protein [Bacillus safensis]MCY7611002.1 helix-turn-helix domain-containing protein [Bacillus safensis]